VPNFQVNNTGPADVVVARAAPGQRYQVRGAALNYADGNGTYFRSGVGGNGISPLVQAPAGAAGHDAGKVIRTNPGEPLVLAITGSGTVTGEVVYDLLAPGQ
jgi:hypothetical protein